MNDTFDIEEKADQPRRKSKSKIIVKMVQQTAECVWFIPDYMKIEGFCMLRRVHWLFCVLTHSYERKRMAKNVGSSGRKDPVDKFKSKFDELRRAFQADGIMEIEIAVLRVVDDLRSLKQILDEQSMSISQLFLASSHHSFSHCHSVE